MDCFVFFGINWCFFLFMFEINKFKKYKSLLGSSYLKSSYLKYILILCLDQQQPFLNIYLYIYVCVCV